MHLFLIRHGQTSGNATGRLQGWTDTPLNDVGHEQVTRTATALAAFLQTTGEKVAALYASPLQRAAVTALTVGQALGLTPTFHPGLREMHFGDMEGLTINEWQEGYPDLHAQWDVVDNLDFGWTGGETRRAFYDRVGGTMNELLAAHRPDDNLVIVSHGGLIANYLSFLTTGEWHHWRRFRVENCSITRVAIRSEDETPSVDCVLSYNSIDHL